MEYHCIDKVFYGIKYENPEILCAFMNSTLALFQAEVYGYSLVGGGGSFITVEDLARLFVLNQKNDRKIISIFDKMRNRKYNTIFLEVGISHNDLIRTQEPNPLPDRKALDDIIFDILGLTEDERKEVYWAVCELVQNRLQKAKSI
jgi:hypothetical protein